MDIQQYNQGNQVNPWRQNRGGILNFRAWLGVIRALQRYREAQRRRDYREIEHYKRDYERYKLRNQREEGDKKRQRTAEDDEAQETQDQPMAPGDGAAGNSGQIMYYRDKITKKKRSIKDLYKNSLSWFIFRFQSLSDFNTTPCSYPLGAVYNTTNQKMDLPMYCFDLASFPQGNIIGLTGAGGNRRGIPFKRMQRQAAAAGGHDYIWEGKEGKFNDPQGVSNSYVWNAEDFEEPDGTTYPSINRYMHDWSDIKIAFNGAKTKPCRVHVKIVKFNDDDYAPYRYTVDQTGAIGTVLPFDSLSPDVDKAIASNSFWDAFWAKRETNPLRTVNSRGAEPVYKVLYHKSFDFAPTNSTDNDTNADQKVCKIFYRSNTTWGTTQYIQDELNGDRVYTDASSEYGFKARVAGGVNQNNACIFPRYNRGEYLLVYADTFQKATNTADVNTIPSFDFVIRNKYSIKSSDV